MGKFTKLIINLVILFISSNSCMLRGIGQIHAHNGPNNTGFLVNGPGTTDNRTDLKSDKEIEDTIREINRYTLSDSLWQRWRSIEDSQFVISKADSINSLKNFAKGAKLAREGFDLINELKQNNLDSLTIRKIKFKAILLFEKSRTYFEETFKLNPYDIRTQNYLIWGFQNLAELHDNCNNTLRAINMLECLTYILHDDPKLYYTLGEKYFNIGRWNRALACIRTSIDLILDDDWNKINTKELFWHYYLRANTEIQLNMIQEALLSLNYAKLIVPGEREAGEIQKKIDWINWDDGNINASIKWDSLDLKLVKGEEDFSTIKQEYLDLLKQVKTVEAQQDINWRIAQLEFKFLNEKEKAVERMLNIIRNFPLDSTKMVESSRAQKYFNDYGSMCYILGMEFLQKKHHKRAFIYFFQSIEFWWNQVGKSYFQLAKLSTLDNQAMLRFAKQSLNFEDHLSRDEQNSLYYLIYMAYKRLGMFDDASKWFSRVANNKVG